MLLRSMLFVPGHNEKFVEKASKSQADALILDMEDSVPEDDKEKARKTVGMCLDRGLFSRKTVFVRTNSLDSHESVLDISAASHRDIYGFMPPKITSRDEIRFLDILLTQKEKEHGLPSGHFKLAPLVETTASVLNLTDIVKDAPRVVAICFGGEDYLNDLRGIHGKPPKAFDVPRAWIAMAARSVGIEPIDTPFLDLSDEQGFMEEKNEAFELGYAGTLLISPRQIQLAHVAFTPDDEEVKNAMEIIQAIKSSKEEGAGCVMLGEVMVGPPMQRKAQQIMALMEEIKGRLNK